jgi:hypothetical protein
MEDRKEEGKKYRRESRMETEEIIGRKMRNDKAMTKQHTMSAVSTQHTAHNTQNSAHSKQNSPCSAMWNHHAHPSDSDMHSNCSADQQ